jgi:hypothetical protein
VKVQIAAMWLGHQNGVDKIWTRSSHLDDYGGAVLDISDEFCFKSACSIAERVLVIDSEVLWSCHDVFCFKSFELPCLTHLLNDDWPRKWNNYAEAIFTSVCAAARDVSHHILIIKDSSISLNASQHCRWTPSSNIVVAKQALNIKSQTVSSWRYRAGAASCLWTDSQMMPKYTPARVRQICIFNLNSGCFLGERGGFKDELWFSSTMR